MKRNFVFAAALSLFVFAFTVSAQTVTNFGGTWTLDVSKSKLDERARIESMSMTVTQTATDIKVETATKRLPPPADASTGGPPGGGGRAGGGGRGGFGGGDDTTVYTLDGKETSMETDGPMGKMPVKLKAGIEVGKLKLSKSGTFSTQMGEISITTKETWSLSDDGKTLTVKRDTESPRGTNSSEMVFTKKP